MHDCERKTQSANYVGQSRGVVVDMISSAVVVGCGSWHGSDRRDPVMLYARRTTSDKER